VRHVDRPLVDWAALEAVAREAARRSAGSRPAPDRGPRGAALLLKNGTIFAGVELGGGEGIALSAERGALYAALLEGRSRPAIILVRGGPRGGGDAGAPSAATLQVLAEFAPELMVHWGTRTRPAGGVPVRDLLPGAFGSGHLPGRAGSAPSS
jgi:cytidine deaminase